MRIAVEIPDQTILDAIASAGVSARSWMATFRRDASRTVDFLDGAKIEITCHDEPDAAYSLDVRKVGKALALMATKEPEWFGKLAAGNTDGGTAGDILIQLAIFGECKYVV